MPIRPSAEDYLETILLLSKKKGAVRSVDIGDEMGFSRPSVSVALKKLREDGLAMMDADGFITLTEKGEAAAAQVYDRHSTLFDWLLTLGVSESTAATDACRMEHVLSEESFAAIRRGLEDRA